MRSRRLSPSPPPLSPDDNDIHDTLSATSVFCDAIHEESRPQAPPSYQWLTPTVCNILVVEAGERFSYFGFRAILVLYFTHLQYTDRQAIAFFAYTSCLAYLSPVAGALLADGPLGRYTTILGFGILYVLGLVILTLGASLN